MTFSIAFQLGASSSSSSPSIFQWNHDVFLSFKGKDVRHNFISHLNRALRQSGIKTYMDGIDLERREQISSELFKAIEESQISIIVFYKNYVESRWCLDELLKILECKKVMKQIVLPIFYKEALEEVANLSGLEYLAIRFSQKYVNTLIFPQQKQVGGLIQLQNTLLSEILGTRLDINDVDRGIGVIWHRLQSKMILLILDDVDEMVQLEKLAGNRAWLGSGSRVIITTRDQHLLDNSKVDLKYEVRTLNVNKALQLFSLYAFEKNEPLKDFVDLSKQVTNYAQGLPLASTVLGSDLKGRSIHQWKSTLDKYKSIPNQNIQRIL
ncbi:disease resistance protein RPV1-like [Carya illinoinensis]|uniref:disease resistance protein RPV1-like n=1 Tax=Carya illinoinensis TaxID=32201 RepID=UPI001C718598|nr:disease resistance protein RPV1-like [Carya illinoinensis]